MRTLSSTLLLLLLATGPAAAVDLVVQPDPGNVVAARIAGSWRLAGEIARRLTGSGAGGQRIELAADPAALAAIPADYRGAFGGRIYLAGHIVEPQHRIPFALVERGGIPRVVSLRPAEDGEVPEVASFEVMLAAAREPAADLLFLRSGGEGQPFVPFERAPEPSPLASALTPETRELLATVIGGGISPAALEALRTKLPARPDWQAVLDLMVDEVRRDPTGEHNDHCLVVEHVLRHHLAEARLDPWPLAGLLSTRSFTNQQKAAQALAVAAGRPELFGGREREAIRALIPLTASQRGRVVDGALEALRKLAPGVALGRDPEGWARWYGERYGEPIDLAGAVFELLAIVRPVKGDGGAAAYSLNGAPAGDLAALTRGVQALKETADRLGLETGVVIILPGAVFDAGNQEALLKEIQTIFGALQPLGLGGLLAAPETDEFHPPFEKGFPRRL